MVCILLPLDLYCPSSFVWKAIHHNMIWFLYTGLHRGQIWVTIWLAFKWQLLKSPSISLSASRWKYWQYWRIGGLCICSSVFLFLEKSVDGFEEVDIEEMEVWARRTQSVWRNVGICRDTRLCWAPQGDRDVVSIWTDVNFHLLRRKRKNY